MKREVERERELPAFSVTVGELEVLWQRLALLFDDPSNLYASIDVRLPSEQLEFANVEELRQYEHLPPQITDFTIRLSQKGRSVRIRSGRLLTAKANVSATSETEAWCAGAIDTVYSFLQSHKLWYSWFVSAPIGWLLFFVSNMPGPVLLLMPKDGKIDRIVVFGWLGAFITLFLLYFGRERLLPSGVLRVSATTGFVRRYVAELSLAIAIVSAILTIIGWFVAK